MKSMASMFPALREALNGFYAALLPNTFPCLGKVHINCDRSRLIIPPGGTAYGRTPARCKSRAAAPVQTRALPDAGRRGFVRSRQQRLKVFSCDPVGKQTK